MDCHKCGLPMRYCECDWPNGDSGQVDADVRPNEHDEYIKLQEQYKMVLKTATYFRDEYNKLYDWLNDKYTDILSEFNESD